MTKRRVGEPAKDEMFRGVYQSDDGSAFIKWANGGSSKPVWSRSISLDLMLRDGRKTASRVEWFVELRISKTKGLAYLLPMEFITNRGEHP